MPATVLLPPVQVWVMSVVHEGSHETVKDVLTAVEHEVLTAEDGYDGMFNYTYNHRRRPEQLNKLIQS